MTDDNLILLLTNKKNYLEKNKNYLSYFPLNPLDNNPNNINIEHIFFIIFLKSN